MFLRVRLGLPASRWFSVSIWLGLRYGGSCAGMRLPYIHTYIHTCIHTYILTYAKYVYMYTDSSTEGGTKLAGCGVLSCRTRVCEAALAAAVI